MEQVEGFLLSPPQSRLWRLQQAFGRHAFNTQFRVLIEGPLNRDLLERSIHSVTERHEILRTNFCPVPELAAPLQVVSDDVAFSLRERDLSRLSAEEREAEIAKILRHDRQSFERESGTTLKLALLRIAYNKHLLFVSLPSLCADGGTAWPLVEDLGRTYAGRVNGQGRREGVIQYSQFSEWQNEMLAGEDGEAGRKFWRKQNAFPLPALTLPFAKKSAGGRRFDPHRYECQIDPEIVRRLDEVAANRGASLSVFLLACWQALLCRLTGQAESVIGLIADGRKYEEMESMPGPFNKCLPLRFEIWPGTRFSEVVQKAEDSVNRASEWQEFFSFDTSETGFAEVTYFPVCYEFSTLPAPIEAGEVSFSLEAIESRVDRFDLTLTCFRKGAALTAAFDFNTDLYGEEGVKGIARYFNVILESALQNGKATVEELNLLPEEEQRHLLIELNRTAQNFPDDGPVHHAFELQVERAPDRLAVASGEEQLTFAELNARANRLAHRLLKSGVGPESVIGVLMGRSAEMIVAILGALKAGAAYLPLDPTYPCERTGFMTDDAGATLLLTHERLQADLLEFTGRLLFIDREWAQIAEESAENPGVSIAPDNLAYVIYTSGSTGRPKGAMISHRGLTNYLNWAAREYEIEHGGGAPLHSSIAFDLSVTSLFGPLIAGRAVVLARATTSVESLGAALRERENFSLVKVTPAHARLLSQQLGSEEAPGRTRFLVLGGAALSAQDISFWRDHAPETRLINEYGPTETVVGCCVYQLGPDSSYADSIPIGRPIANTQIYLLDRLMRPTPVGVPGELYIAGAGLARGYLKRPDLTAEKFVPNPFGSESGARMYRTGDLARYLPDGNIDFLGRVDEQLKIRGYRVEPGEIAAALVEHAAVREAAVVAKEDGRGEPRLVAYIAPENEEPDRPWPSVSELRGFLEKRLPEYMIPVAYVRLDELPLTANGKVDRRALPEPDEISHGKGTSYVAPRTLEEEVLAGVWSQVLGARQIGIDDGYFALGGDSIRSLQVVALARKRGVRFTIDELFRHQTIRELAREIRGRESKRESPPQVRPYCLISPEDREKITGDIEDAYPLSKLQAGMIFHREYQPESAIYHDICSFHLRSPLNLELMKESIARLAGRHAALRASFDLTNFSEPLNLVHRHVSIPLGVEDINHLSPETQKAALAEWVEMEKKRDFDYATPPLLRFHIHVRSAETFQFTLSFHHAILDGWSDATMITELAVSYYLLLRGETVPFQPPATQYRDFIALEKQAIEDESTRRFWLDRLEGHECSAAPRWSSSANSTGVRRGQAGRRGIARWDIPISKEVSEGLKDLALEMAVPVKSVLLAAHMRTLSLLAGNSDVVTFLTVVGRPETDEGDKTLGLFLNSTPFRLKLNGGTWADLVKMAFEAEHEALPFRRYPMAEMQKLRGGARLAETGFYFTHYYIYRNLEAFPEFELLGAEFYEETSIPFLANFALEAFSSDVICYLTCDRTQIGEEQLRTIGGYYAKALAALAQDPSGRYEALSLLSDQERRQLLVDWGGKEAGKWEERPAHVLFESQAARAPFEISVEAGDQQCTYGELNRRANQLAHYLLAHGIGPETVVAICLERSCDLAVAALGTLKAGAAFLPLDSGYPMERLRFILEDAQAALMLTQESLLERLPFDQSPILRLDAQWESVAPYSCENPTIKVTPDNLAYVIYTSGSTGRPKGVTVPHRGLSNYLAWCVDHYLVDQAEGALAHSSIAFDLTLTALLGPLVGGQKVIMAPDAAGVEGLGATLREKKNLSFIKLTPSHLRLLTEQLRGAELAGRAYRLILGGEALTAADVAMWRDGATETLIINEYGPTECVVGCSVYEAGESEAGHVPIGRPIAGARLYALDDAMMPAPLGVAGELYVGGTCVARGYLGRPELTAERFAPDPFSAKAGARMYRTGDIARWSVDGNLEYLGRRDDQVKVRGYRIELGEIEATLREHDWVREAAVAVKDDGTGNQRLVAYVVLEESGRYTTMHVSNVFRGFLGTKLPEHMAPSAYILLEALPLTANGKVDRRALPEPDGARSESAFVAPRTPQEEVLAGIWSKIFGMTKIGIDDDYFALGGDSIRSIQVVSLAREKGLRFTLGEVFEHRTIRQLAGAAGNAEAAAMEPPITEPFGLISEQDKLRLPGDVEDSYPLTRLQAGMIYHREMHPNSAIYHDIFSLRLKATLDIDVLRQAVQELSDRHPALRTSFDLTGFTEPLQLVYRKATIPLGVEDLRLLPAAEQETALAAWIEAEKRRGFDHTRPPLLRFQVHLLSAEIFQFTLSFHHAILDGWSDATMLTELAINYHFLLRGEKSPYEAPRTRFRDFVALEREALESAECRGYWLERLEGCEPFILPRLETLTVRSQEQATGQARNTRGVIRQAVAIPENISDGLQKLSLAEAVPLKDVLLAAHMKVVSLLAGSPEVITTVTSSGRPEKADGDRVLGLFLNSTPFRLTLEGGTWRDLIQKTFETERESLPFRRYPLAELQRLRGGQRISEMTFYFTHYHIYHNLRRFAELEVLDLEPYEETSFTAVAMFGLDPFTARVTLQLSFDKTQISEEQARVYADYYGRALTEMASNPSGRYDLFSPLSQAELHQLLIKWNDTQTKYPESMTVHQLFEAQAELAPDNTAIVFGDVHVTYRELNQRANRLANYLIKLGVSPEVPVAVFAERSVELVTALLAILKAGSLYVPLDPAYPSERIEFVLDDAKATIVLVDRRTAASLPSTKRIVFLDDPAAFAYESEESLEIEIDPQNLAYLIYTSGSTGRPKGVAIEHGSAATLVQWAGQVFSSEEIDGVLAATSICFDLSVFELFVPLCLGGKVILAENALELPSLAAVDQVRLINTVPSAMAELVRLDAVPASVRTVNLAGEALQSLLVEQVYNSAKVQKVYNLYGPSEDTTYSTFALITADRNGAPPIGRPISNTQVYILDRRLQPVPVGVIGELYIGGDGLARGYIKRPELTAERFIPNPFGKEPGARLYRSGDLARHLPDGNLEFLGRLDDQVKLRGYRIEPGEIEAALRRHPQIREAVVLARQDSPGEKRLVAYLLSDHQPAPTTNEMRAFLKGHIPDYMLPSAFLLLDELPLMPNGKVDRRALPAPDQTRPGVEVAYVAPRTPVEEAIATIWSQALKIEQIGIYDNFFDLGGHSLTATQIVSRIRAEFQAALPLRDLLSAPTIAALAERLETIQWVAREPSLSAPVESFDKYEI